MQAPAEYLAAGRRPTTALAVLLEPEVLPVQLVPTHTLAGTTQRTTAHLVVAEAHCHPPQAQALVVLPPIARPVAVRRVQREPQAVLPLLLAGL